FLEIAKVLAGGKRPAGAGDDDDANVRIALGVFQGLIEFRSQFIVERVEHIRPVERDGADGIGSVNGNGLRGSGSSRRGSCRHVWIPSVAEQRVCLLIASCSKAKKNVLFEQAFRGKRYLRNAPTLLRSE